MPINIQIDRTGDVLRSKSFTNAHGARIVAAYQRQANIAINGTATTAQVIDYVLSRIVADIKATVIAHEKQQAVAAVPEPAPIEPT